MSAFGFSIKDNPNIYKRDQFICRGLLIITILSMLTGFYFIVEYINSILQSLTP